MKNLTLSDLRNRISFCIKDLMHYNDLGFILNNLEASILLPNPIKTKKMTDEEYYADKEVAISIFEQGKDTYHILSEELDLRKNTFEKIRKRHPNFCKDIQSNLTKEEYKKYIDLLRQVKDTLNYIINASSTDKLTSNELLQHRKDKASSLIDSNISIRLGNIEDTFVLNELNKIDITLLDPQTQQNIERIKSDITVRMQKFAEYSKLYSAKKIQFKGRPLKSKSLKEREIGD